MEKFYHNRRGNDKSFLLCIKKIGKFKPLGYPTDMRVLLTSLHSKFIHPSLALPYLAAYCSDLPLDIRIEEFTVHEPRENILETLLRQEPEVIGFSVYLWNRVATLELVAALHRIRPDIRIFLGGPEISFETNAFMGAHPGVTALIRGEGEIPAYGLLTAWQKGQDPAEVPRLLYRTSDGEIRDGGDGPQLDALDSIPSPFRNGLVDLDRGFVYIETSRGCPYDCSFCMSALEDHVRSFSPGRIEDDLLFLMKQEIPKIKLVDRTFNYDATRARRIFSFILAHNRSSHFHFEIGAHLLDEETLRLLEKVPKGMFQFEIGVQATLPEALQAIRRKASLEKLEKNVRRLQSFRTIELHLDLIAGLPGEPPEEFFRSIDRVMALGPDHLQIEPVKLLPGAPLRLEAGGKGLLFDPNPPYQVLQTPEWTFEAIHHVRGVSRLLDMTWNSHRLQDFLARLGKKVGSFSQGLAQMATWFQQQDLLRHPLSQEHLFSAIHRFLQSSFPEDSAKGLIDQLGFDASLAGRISPNKVPAYLDPRLTDEESRSVQAAVAEQLEKIRGQGIKQQHFAAAFSHLSPTPQRQIILFLYHTAPGRKMAASSLSVPIPGR